MSGIRAKAVNTTARRGMPTRRMSRLAEIVFAGERRSGAVNIVLINDAKMKSLNREYRNRNSTTDVLSFAFDDDDLDQPPPLIGEIYISVPEASRRAKKAERSLADELLFLTSHGLLHVLGYTHETTAKFERMIETQLHYLNKLYKR